MRKLLSIAVPTKDRYECLKCFIESVDEFAGEEIEMVVQDNTLDNSEFVVYLGKHNYEFLKYFHIEQQISMSQNCEEAVKHCSGKYVCLMGDDDFVTKELIQYVHYMEKNSIDAASFSAKAHYFWPGVKHVAHSMPNLFIPHFDSKEHRVDCEKELGKLVAHGAAELKGLPKLYHAVVLKERLDEIRSKMGTCFPGESPDIAIAIALSTVVTKAVVCDIPYIVSGTVPKSAGGMGAAHTHNRRIEDVPWLSGEAKKAWEKKVPTIWTGTTIYADTAIKTLRKLDKQKELGLFNYLYSYAFTLVFEDGCGDYIKRLVGKNYLKWLIIGCYILYIICYRALHYLDNLRIFKLKITRAYKNNNVENSYVASKLVSTLILSRQRAR